MRRRFTFDGKEELTLPAKREVFSTLKEWLNSIGDELNFKLATKRQMLVVADEIFTNIASYAYPEGGGNARIVVDFDTDTLEICLTFSDDGLEYNPLEAKSTDVTLPLRERKPGGLGIFLVRKLMDTVEYKREGNSNVLILKKRVEVEV